MTHRQAYWLIVSGLLVWAVLTVLWSTGPYDCTAPDPETHRVTCK